MHDYNAKKEGNKVNLHMLSLLQLWLSRKDYSEVQ